IRSMRGWYDLERALQPEVRSYRLSERRWDGAIAKALAHESVSSWLRRTRASRSIRSTAIGMRGFFLADPEELSLLAMVDQFAEEGLPAGQRLFRIRGGNDQIPSRLARLAGRRLQMRTVLRRVEQAEGGVLATVEFAGTRHQLRSHFLICAIPATT